MEAIPLKFSVVEILSLVEKLPKEIKLILLKKWQSELKEGSGFFLGTDLRIEGYDEPFDLEDAAFDQKNLAKLQALWKDEPSAEELAVMLTP